MMRHVEVVPNKDLAQDFLEILHILYYIAFRSMDLLHPMRWNKAELLIFETRLRSIFGENAVCQKRDARILAPSWNLPAWKDSLVPCFSILQLTSSSELHLKRVLTFHKCVANVFKFAQQVGIFDTLIRKARTCVFFWRSLLLSLIGAMQSNEDIWVCLKIVYP